MQRFVVSLIILIISTISNGQETQWASEANIQAYVVAAFKIDGDNIERLNVGFAVENEGFGSDQTNSGVGRKQPSGTQNQLLGDMVREFTQRPGSHASHHDLVSDSFQRPGEH